MAAKPTIGFSGPAALGTKAIDEKITVTLSRSASAGLLGASATLGSPAFATGKTYKARFRPRATTATVKVRLSNAGSDQLIRISATDSSSSVAPGAQLKVTVAKPQLGIDSVGSATLDKLKIGEKVKVKVKRDLVIPARGVRFQLASRAFADGTTYPGEIRRGQDATEVEVTLARAATARITLEPSSPADPYHAIDRSKQSKDIKVLEPVLSLKPPVDLGEKHLGEEVKIEVQRSYDASLPSKARLNSSAFRDPASYPVEIPPGKESVEVAVRLNVSADDERKIKLEFPENSTIDSAASEVSVKVLVPKLSFKSATDLGTKKVGDEVELEIQRKYAAPFASKVVLSSTAFDDAESHEVEIPAGKESVKRKVKLIGADEKKQKIRLAGPASPAALEDPQEIDVLVAPPQISFTGSVLNADDTASGGKFWMGLDSILDPKARIKLVLDSPAPKGGAKALLSLGSKSAEVVIEAGKEEKTVNFSLRQQGKNELSVAAVSGCKNHSADLRRKRDVEMRTQPTLTFARKDGKTTPFRVEDDEIELSATLSEEAPPGKARVMVGCPKLGAAPQLVEFEAGETKCEPETFVLKATEVGIDQPIEVTDLRGCKMPRTALKLSALPVASFHKKYPIRPTREPVEYTRGEKARITVVLNAPAPTGGAKLRLTCPHFVETNGERAYAIDCPAGAARIEKVIHFDESLGGTAPEEFTILLETDDDTQGAPRGGLVAEAATAKEVKGKLRPLPAVKFAPTWITPSTEPHYAGDRATVKIDLAGPAPEPDGATFKLRSAAFTGDYEVVVKGGAKSAEVQVEWARGDDANKSAVELVVEPNDKGCVADATPANVRKEIQVKNAPAVEFATAVPAVHGTQHDKDAKVTLKVRLLDPQGHPVPAPITARFKIRSTAFGATVYRGSIKKAAREATVGVTLAVGYPETAGAPPVPPAWQQILVEPISGCIEGTDAEQKMFLRVRVKDDAANPPAAAVPCQMAGQNPNEIARQAPKHCNQTRLLLAEVHGEEKNDQPQRGDSSRGIFEFVSGSRKDSKYADAFLSGQQTIEVIAGGEDPADHAAHTTWLALRGEEKDKRCKEEHAIPLPSGGAPLLLKHPHIAVSFNDGEGHGVDRPFPEANWRTRADGTDGLGAHSGHENAEQKQALHEVRLHPPPQHWMDVMEKKIGGIGVPFGSAFRAISISKKLVKARSYRIKTFTCGYPDPAGSEKPVRTIDADVKVYPSDEFALALSVKPVPAMHWGYTGRFVGPDGELLDPDTGAGGDKSLDDYTSGENFGSDLLAGGQVGTIDGAAAFGQGQDTDAWAKQYEEGGSDRGQATIGDIGDGDGYRASTTLNDKGLVFLNTIEEQSSDLFVDDGKRVAASGPREVRKKRKGSLSFHAGSDSEHPQTWEDGNKMLGTVSSGGGPQDIQSHWSEFYGDDSEGKVWLAPAQVRDRFSVSLSHNGEDDPQWDTIATTINTLISTIQHFGEMFTKLQDMVPSYGLGFQLSMGFLEGDLTYRWGWKEHTDHRVFPWKEVSAELMLFRLSLRVDFGARWRVLFIQFEAIVYAQVTGELGLAGYWQIDEPDGKMALEESSLGAPCKAEAGVNVVLLHDNILHLNGAIKTGIEFKFRFTFEESFRTEYERNFMGLSVSATFKLICVCDINKEKYLIEGDPPGTPAVRKLLFPRSQVGGYWDIRSNMSLLWRKVAIEYAKLQGALDAWHELQMEILRKRDPLDRPPAPTPSDPRGWPYTANPGLKEVDLSLANPQADLTEVQDWSDQWEHFKDALRNSQGDWITDAGATTTARRTDKKVKKRSGLTRGRRSTDTLRNRLLRHIAAMDELVKDGVRVGTPVPGGWRFAKTDLGLRQVMVDFHDDYFAELRKLDYEINLKEDDDPGLPTDKKAQKAAIEKRKQELEPIRNKLTRYTKEWMPLRVKPTGTLSAREKTRQLLRAMNAGMDAIRHYQENHIVTWKRWP